MQAESGQGLVDIVARKEMERRAGGGLFLWGVGNAPSRAIPQLARMEATVGVIFSVMKSKPKAHDVAPARVVAWRRWIDPAGAVRELPEHALVTSRAGKRDHHYALICFSSDPLVLSDEEPFDPAAYRNFGGGRPVGASQTTALLQRHAPEGVTDYRISMRARLTGGLWVKLVDPVEITSPLRKAVDVVPSSIEEWVKLARTFRRSPALAGGRKDAIQETLFAL